MFGLKKIKRNETSSVKVGVFLLYLLKRNNMIEKLVKTGNDYILYSKDKTVFGITSGTMEGRMLSLKNCEAIENGYDLDEIKRKLFDGFDGQPSSFTTAAVEHTIQIMVEILGDKKYSEEDVKFMFQLGFNLDNAISRNEYDAHIQSLQQTEWDVEICCYIGNGDKESDSFKDPLVTNTGIPKLDSDGCLILRRI